MKTWFITGLARGDAVVATTRDPPSVIDRLGQKDKLLALALDVDVDAPAQADAAARRAHERFGRIDVLVNNAGYGLVSAVVKATAKRWRRCFAPTCSGCSPSPAPLCRSCGLSGQGGSSIFHRSAAITSAPASASIRRRKSPSRLCRYR